MSALGFLNSKKTVMALASISLSSLFFYMYENAKSLDIYSPDIKELT